MNHRVYSVLGMTALLIIAVVHILTNMLSKTNGVFIYGLDDPYIHLSIARTLVDHGMVGVSEDAVSFANSSVLWPLLLAMFIVVGGYSDLWPLIINIMTGIGSFWLIAAIAARHKIHPLGGFLLMLLMFIMSPYVPLMFNGMEHIMHIFVLLLVLHNYLRLPEHGSTMGVSATGLLVSIIIAVLVRPETIFLGFALCIVLLLRKQFKLGLSILVASVLPQVLTGIAMVAAGGEFLSYSMMVKARVHELSMLADVKNIYYYSVLLPMLSAEGWQFYTVLVLLAVAGGHASLRSPRKRITELLLACALIVPIHVYYIGHGPLQRYSGYLFATTIVIFFLYWLMHLQSKMYMRKDVDIRIISIPSLVLFFFAVLPLISDGMYNYRQTVTASVNIYQQQYQMALFLREHYEREAVVLNDIGLTVLHGNAIPVDLVGLSEKRVARARRARAFTTDSIRAVVSDYNVRIGVLYKSWFQNEMELPQEWLPVGEWKISDNIVCGDDVVTFYAIDTTAAATLAAFLDDFETRLPVEVITQRVWPE
jgi:hypothetical protein